MTTREELRQIIEQLPEGELAAVRSMLEEWLARHDPMLLALLNAPIDDEPTMPEEDAEAEEAWQEYLRGEAKPWEQVKKELWGVQLKLVAGGG